MGWDEMQRAGEVLQAETRPETREKKRWASSLYGWQAEVTEESRSEIKAAFFAAAREREDVQMHLRERLG